MSALAKWTVVGQGGTIEREYRKESINIAVRSVVKITMKSFKTSAQVLNNPATRNNRRTNNLTKTPEPVELSSKIHKKSRSKELLKMKTNTCIGNKKIVQIKNVTKNEMMFASHEIYLPSVTLPSKKVYFVIF